MAGNQPGNCCCGDQPCEDVESSFKACFCCTIDCADWGCDCTAPPDVLADIFRWWIDISLKEDPDNPGNYISTTDCDLELVSSTGGFRALRDVTVQANAAFLFFCAGTDGCWYYSINGGAPVDFQITTDITLAEDDVLTFSIESSYEAGCCLGTNFDCGDGTPVEYIVSTVANPQDCDCWYVCPDGDIPPHGPPDVYPVENDCGTGANYLEDCGAGAPMMAPVEYNESIKIQQQQQRNAVIRAHRDESKRKDDGQIPGIAQRLITFGQSLVKFAAAGMPYRQPEEIQLIWNQHCSQCPFLVNDVCGHPKCGCKVQAELKFRNKLAWSTERCPDGRW